MTDRGIILLFLKAPQSGQVKSRLASAIGDRAALELYQCFVRDIIGTIDRSGMPSRLFVDGADMVPAVATWLGKERSYDAQSGRDLGARMENAFRSAFNHGTQRTVLIGSDLPDLPAYLLHEAMAALESCDAVIGPARDGGYYLIGFRRERFLPEIFRGITWSRPDVFERTMQEFRKSGASVHILPLWQDVDTVDDLRDLLERTGNTAFALSRTIEYLETIRDRLSGAEGSHGEL